MAEVSSPVLVNPANTKEKRPLLAGNQKCELKHRILFIFETDGLKILNNASESETEGRLR